MLTHEWQEHVKDQALYLVSDVLLPIYTPQLDLEILIDILDGCLSYNLGDTNKLNIPVRAIIATHGTKAILMN